MMDHVENQLSEGTWNLMGWFKAVTTKEDGIVQPKFHVVRLETNGVTERFVVSWAVDDGSSQQNHNIRWLRSSNREPNCQSIACTANALSLSAVMAPVWWTLVLLANRYVFYPVCLCAVCRDSLK